MFRTTAGFTLLEILIVLVIVGILATLGFINYTGVREHAVGKEAQANLKLIAAAEKIYRLETGGYYGPDSDIGMINTYLKLSLTGSPDRSWDYAINSATASTFSAEAERIGSGGYLDCAYSIDQSLDEPAAGASCP